MPASLEHIHPGMPMGANLVAGGATFRVWAPGAHSVHVIGDFNGRSRDEASLRNRDARGHWLGFVPGVRDRGRYMFYVAGDGGEGPKRDPYARDLQTPLPGECIVRETDFPQGRHYGGIFGTLMGLGIAGAAGPWVTGLAYDLSGGCSVCVSANGDFHIAALFGEATSFNDLRRRRLAFGLGPTRRRPHREEEEEVRR